MQPEQKGARESGVRAFSWWFSTKIHASCDSHGNPLHFILTAGQESDYKQAVALLESKKTTVVLADKGYDADYVMKAAESIRAQAVIPPKSSRKIRRVYDKELYKERNLIERMFNQIKNFRRVATRYDKIALSFLAFIHIVGIYG